MKIVSNKPQGSKLKFNFGWIKGMALNIISIKKSFSLLEITVLKGRGRTLSCKVLEVLFYHSVKIIFGGIRSAAFNFIATSSAVASSAFFFQTSKAAAELLLICAVTSSSPHYTDHWSHSWSVLKDYRILEFLYVTTEQGHRLGMDKAVGPAAGKMGFRFSYLLSKFVPARGNAPG